MSTTSQFFSGGTSIKSIQRGTIASSSSANAVTATISSVNTAKSELRYLGVTSSSTVNGTYFARIELTNATTLTATFSAPSTIGVIGWELTEWN